ncbi:MAG: DNA repair protein RadC [Elusimicrobia bacterium]|nr:DNA repair protein RadC [Elusimicrobiota bacterium]
MPFDIEKVDLPREKLSKTGVSSLKDEELLAIILGTGYKGKNVLQLSKEILKNYPTGDFIQLPISKLKAIKGFGSAKASVIAAAVELVKRGLDKNVVAIKKPTDVLPYTLDIRDRKREHFVVFYLNARNEILKRDFVSIGTLNASLVHPREVFKPAIEHSAASVIFVHNHPSGDTTPSEDDIKLTKRLIAAADILGIEILDHIIISKTDYLSMKSKNLI